MNSRTGGESKSSSAVFCAEVEPGQGAGVGLGGDEEVEQHLVDVLDLVVPLLDGLLRPHEGGDVAADPQAALVGVRRGLAHQVPGKRVVDLDLPVAVLRVPVDRILGPLQVVDHEAAAGRHRALPFDVPGGHDMREQQLAGLLAAHEALKRAVVVAHVAHREYARRQVQSAVPRAEMGVHVEQSRQQHAATRLHDLLHPWAREPAGSTALMRPR